MACLKSAIIVILCAAEVYGKCVLESGMSANKREQILLDKVNSISGTKLTVADEKAKYDLFVCGNEGNITAKQIMKNKEYVLGLANRTAITAGNKWLMTTHYGGFPYKTDNTCKNKTRMIHFMFVCDPLKSKAEAQFIEERKNKNECFYMVEVSHPSLCDSETGLSGTSIFFLLLFIGFGCYFVFGFLYRRLIIGAQGIEQIPNRLFWCKVGNKLADGCEKVLRCDRWCGRGTSGSSYDGYTPIDEQLAQDLQDTERDSTLLSP